MNALVSLNFNSYSKNTQDNSFATNFQLRGGTSGVHARKLSDFEELKVKNKSLFNKYKESRKDV